MNSFCVPLQLLCSENALELNSWFFGFGGLKTMLICNWYLVFFLIRWCFIDFHQLYIFYVQFLMESYALILYWHLSLTWSLFKMDLGFLRERVPNWTFFSQIGALLVINVIEVSRCQWKTFYLLFVIWVLTISFHLLLLLQIESKYLVRGCEMWVHICIAVDICMWSFGGSGHGLNGEEAVFGCSFGDSCLDVCRDYYRSTHFLSFLTKL